VRDTLKADAWWLRTELTALLGLPPAATTATDRNVILLAWSFPPRVDGGTHRVVGFARYGSALGWNVFVVGAQPDDARLAAGEYLLRAVPRSVQVTRLPYPSLRPSTRWSPTIDCMFLSALAIFDAARNALQGSRPAAVIASGPPFHMFAAGYYLARAYRCKLVLDYRDEWTECPFDFVVRGNMDAWWERRCLKAADAVVFTTGSHLEHQLRVFPMLDRAKCVVIPNGWEPGDASTGGDGLVRTQDSDRQTIQLSFVGTLGTWTSPGRFLSTLNEVLRRRPDLKSRLRITFVGRKSPLALGELAAFPHQEILELIDEVPKSTAAGIMRDSTALFLLNPEPLARYVPGKLYEYLGARRPVLVFGDGGEVAALVRKLDAGLVVPPHDDAALERALADIGSGAACCECPSTVAAWLDAHTRERLTRDFFDIVARLIDS